MLNAKIVKSKLPKQWEELSCNCGYKGMIVIKQKDKKRLFLQCQSIYCSQVWEVKQLCGCEHPKHLRKGGLK